MDKTSNFMTDHSLGDKGKEAVMDFQVSWVLRMAADDEYTKDKPAFHLFCKYMLYKLLGMEFPNPKKIVKVKVWKEWENIDLCVEVVLNNKGMEETHVILIENKVYTNMKINQRDEYPNTVKQFYKDKIDDDKFHQVLITCAETDEEIKQVEAFCEGTAWKVMSIYNIILDLDIETESELFNEFWIYNWGRLDN